MNIILAPGFADFRPQGYWSTARTGHCILGRAVFSVVCRHCTTFSAYDCHIHSRYLEQCTLKCALLHNGLCVARLKGFPSGGK